MESGELRSPRRQHVARSFWGISSTTFPSVQSLQLARKAGRIDAEEQSRGIRIAFQDLLTGVSALDLGYAVMTHTVRYFHMIPNLDVKQI